MHSPGAAQDTDFNIAELPADGRLDSPGTGCGASQLPPASSRRNGVTVVLVVVVPVLLVFVVFQRYVVQGFALSGLK